MVSFTCPICATLDQGVDVFSNPLSEWDWRRLDDKGEPLIWPYLDVEETESEKFARCPSCVKGGRRSSICELPASIQRIVDEASTLYSISKELAFFRLLKNQLVLSEENG